MATMRQQEPIIELLNIGGKTFGRTNLPYDISLEGDTFILECRDLPIVTAAKTPEELMYSYATLLAGYLQYWEQKGSLSLELRKRGIRLMHGTEEQRYLASGQMFSSPASRWGDSALVAQMS